MPSHPPTGKCEFIEVAPGQWYYGLEMWVDLNKWNWRFDAVDSAGPFATQAAANAHLNRYYTPPATVRILAYGEFTMTTAYENWIRNACGPTKRP